MRYDAIRYDTMKYNILHIQHNMMQRNITITV